MQSRKKNVNMLKFKEKCNFEGWGLFEGGERLIPMHIIKILK